MGCGSSSTSVGVETPASGDKSNNNNTKNAKANGEVHGSPARPTHPRQQSAVSASGVETGINANQKPIPKSVAFSVDFGNQNGNIDKILSSKGPPKRLQRLEPLESLPKLTAEQLEEKMRLAEEKRQKQIERKKQKSRKATSRLQKRLQEAKQFEESQLHNQEEQLEGKLREADQRREAKRIEMEEKKRKREEKAQQIRERAAQLKKEGVSGMEFDMEKDESYNDNKDDEDWMSEQPSRPLPSIDSESGSAHQSRRIEVHQYSTNSTGKNDYSKNNGSLAPTDNGDGFWD